MDPHSHMKHTCQGSVKYDVQAGTETAKPFLWSDIARLCLFVPSALFLAYISFNFTQTFPEARIRSILFGW